MKKTPTYLKILITWIVAFALPFVFKHQWLLLTGNVADPFAMSFVVTFLSVAAFILTVVILIDSATN